MKDLEVKERSNKTVIGNGISKKKMLEMLEAFPEDSNLIFSTNEKDEILLHVEFKAIRH